MRVRRSLLALTIVGFLGLTGCGETDSAGAAGSEQLTSARTTDVEALNPCAQQNLTTVVPAQFTVAVTDRQEPALLGRNDDDEWIGREAEIVYSLAERLGFDSAQVTWLEDTFTPESFVAQEGADVLVGQVSAQEMTGAGGEASVPFGTAGQTALVMGLLPGNPLRSCVDEVLISMESDGQMTAS